MSLASQISALATAIGQKIKAIDLAAVHITNNESIAGVKTFTLAPVIPDGVAAQNPVAFHQLPTTLAPTGAASGDLSGTYPGPTVAKVGGVGISGTPADGSVPLASSSTVAVWNCLSAITQIVSKNIDYTLLQGDEVLFDTSTGNRIGTLPTAPPKGTVVGWKKITGDVNTLSIKTAGNVTIDGVNATTTPIVLTEGQQANQAFYDGTGWQIFITSTGFSAEPKIKLFKKTTANILPSATANTLGTSTVIAPTAPATQMMLSVLNWTISSGISGETISIVITVTFDDFTTSSITPGGVLGNVTSATVFNDNTKTSFFKDGRTMISFAIQVKSSIASSTAKVVAICGGFTA